jgi:large subunit ribosomal protein L13
MEKEIIIDGRNAVLGRVASYAAKQALQGNNVVVVNSEDIIITGRKEDIKKKFIAKRGRVGSTQQGPKHSQLPERIVKRSIRGMLPDHRRGRGKAALQKIRCYQKIPKEYEGKKMITLEKEINVKFMKVDELRR